MFDNLKIGKKMLLLSGGILILLLIVLTVGMYGLRATADSGREVANGGNLSTELAQLEVDHLQWADDVSRFIHDNQVNELQVETDHTRCGFGRWYYGEGRQQAEMMVPELHDVLRAIEEPHARLHASAKKIATAYRVADPDLPEFLTRKELDHMGWAYKIQQAIMLQSNGVDVKFDHTKCSLGQFLYGEAGLKAAADNPQLKDIFDRLLAPHEQLHAHGKRIDTLLRGGDYTGAQRYFATEVARTLTEVSGLVHQANQVAGEALSGQKAAQGIYAGETQASLHQVQQGLRDMRRLVSTHSANLTEASARSVKAQSTTILTIGVFALLLGTAIAVLISRSMTGPLQQTASMLAELENGHLGTRLALHRKDEIGLMAESMDRFADSLQHEVVDSLQKLADGNLDFQVVPHDDNDLLRRSLQKLGEDLNGIMSQILIAGDEISSASEQVADASQSLSQGATEQAASLEEISASLNQTSSQTTTNAENAGQAKQLSMATREAAEKGSSQMAAMVAAMGDINEAGQNISKIIKTIDEIAFQTNLLALNAAVEAARAGQHGKGFAVVAEEVRNLAARSAKAAAETAELIEGSVAKTENGSAIAAQTAAALTEIVDGVSKVSDLVAEIAAASNDQAQGVAEINQGVGQIDMVTQQNTASAQQSAAAAEEMSAQAAELKRMLQRFTLAKVPASGHRGRPELHQLDWPQA